MHQDLITSYQSLFDIQLSDMTVLEDLEKKISVRKTPGTQYALQIQIIDLKGTIEKRKLKLRSLDDRISMFGSLTIKEAERKTDRHF